jgi:hypothetical protein
MSQTLALFIDAYRELNARKLFWITMILSGVLMLAFAACGATDTEFTFLTFSWPVPMARTIYKAYLLRLVLISIWISWGAVILALFSTAGIFPEFIANGSIDLYLSKPIGRLRLFLTKYAAALLFVVLQATVFSVIAFVVVGLRIGEWKPGLLLAIPLLTLMFSYLYAVCVLVGVMTRSTIAAMLVTILFWLFIAGVGWAENILLVQRTSAEVTAQVQSARADRLQKRLSAAERNPLATAPADEPPATRPAVFDMSLSNRRSPDRQANLGTPDALRAALAEARSEAEEAGRTADKLEPWHRSLYIAHTLLPKTSETISVMDETLFNRTEMDELDDRSERRFGRGATTGEDPDTDWAAREEISHRRIEALRTQIGGRTVAWSIGTSLIFEAVILAWAAWIFCRRDY